MDAIMLTQHDHDMFEKFLDMYEQLIDTVQTIREIGQQTDVDFDDEAIEYGDEAVDIIRELSRIVESFDDEQLRDELEQFLLVGGDVYCYSIPSGYLEDGEFSIYATEDIREYVEDYLKVGTFDVFDYDMI